MNIADVSEQSPSGAGTSRVADVNERPSSGGELRVVLAHTPARRVDVCRKLFVKSGLGDVSGVLQMSRNNPGHGLTEAQTKVDAYAVCVHMCSFEDFDMWCDARHHSSCALAPGTVHINDMRHLWQADIRSPFHVVNFYIPQSALDAITEEGETSRIEGLRCPISNRHVDTVLKNFALAMLPALASPHQTNRLFVDHTLRAVAAHLTRTYGSSQQKLPVVRGGLASWQERRAKELLLSNLSGEITLSELASACRVSTSHFSQAFKKAVGCAPHQWLLQKRVERAKQLMLNTRVPLTEIALLTGFADQSHLTRVFSRRVKASPAAWRRAQGRFRESPNSAPKICRDSWARNA